MSTEDTVIGQCFERRAHLIPAVLATVMLLAALGDWPYGYYVLLRWVCCPAFAYLAMKAFEQKKEGWVWVLGVTALVYNPILRVHLTRGIWSVVNIITVVIVVASVFVLRQAPPSSKSIGDHADSTSST